MTNKISWALAIYVAFVFLQSLFFKFTGSEETVIIFNTIGDWMAGIGFLAPASGPFREYGGVTVGSVELVASGLVLLPRTRAWGALIGIGVISGAIFFHLFTPLGVDRVVDAEGHTDGGVLFMMACGVWVACAALIAIHRRTLPIIGRAGH
ncbi:MAG: hypothetical protein KDI19_12110 [Pseudomonadales bacterium]|nr:hypothetical protein [Pseudomonadales bacterium]